MDEEFKSMNNDLNASLTNLSSAKLSDGELIGRKQNLAMLIKLHLQQIQHTVITKRRRGQHRMRRRIQFLRTLFLKQMMELQSNYLQMFTILRKKHDWLTTSTVSESICNEKSKDQTDFFENLMPLLDDEDFLSTFHISRSMFRWLCSHLKPFVSLKLGSEDVVNQQYLSISPEKCIALALYIFARGDAISIISERFDMPSSCVLKALRIFCKAVISRLGKFMRLLPHSEADCARVIAGFQRKTRNIPDALVGVLAVLSLTRSDGSPLRVEFLLDDRMLFRELKLSDANSEPLSPMFGKTPNRLTNLPARCINKRMVPPFLLAPVHHNFPLRPWILQRYSYPLSSHEYQFNVSVETLHKLSYCTLHRLMSRWHYLANPLVASFHTASNIITACCILHNVVEEMGDLFVEAWGNSIDMEEFRMKPSFQTHDSSNEAQLALELRDFLARTIHSTES